MAVEQRFVDRLATDLDREDDGLTTKAKQSSNVVTIEWWDPDRDDRPRGIYEITLDTQKHTIDHNILNFDAEYRSAGFYRKLITVMADWTRDVGVTLWRVPLLAERGGEFHKDLVDTGFVENEDGVFEVDVSDPSSSRIDQYNRWVNDGKGEPAWHKELTNNFKVTKV
jgi:GNAT superfamily N-acetyltransferase